PNLEHKLPDSRGVTFFTKKEELKAYNEMVRAYNAELDRRRRYLLQLTAEDALLVAAELERLLAYRDEPLTATVIASQALPSKTFAKIHGTAPGAWVREAAAKGRAVADRAFTSATVLVTSYPGGATVGVSGQTPQAGPSLMKDVAVGTSLAVSAERPGYLPGTTTASVKASPGGVMRVEVALTPTAETLAAMAKGPAPAAKAAARGATAGTGGAWAARGERGTFIVSQEAPNEWTADGGKVSRPELILRCAAGVREAYLFYEHGFPATEGDLFARFDGEGKPKKFWGAPSQNGQSLFFTGFWTKGTDGFIRELLKHRTMHLSVKPKKKEALPELQFDLQGLEPAMSAWLQACPIKK
ncbi:MAG TPA: hypothetical protein VFM29_07505, partial [Vicinamibacteria bacterium]|nr:hypothetical protein [Vicinamibacteria bacterium]